MKPMKSKELTFIALSVALGLVIKMVTDTFMRTFLFFLMWDPLMIINTCIFIKFKNRHHIIPLVIIETMMAAVLFMNTDIYFLRPFSVIITYLACRFIKTKKITTKYFWATFCSLLFNLSAIFLLFLLFPQILNIDTMKMEELFTLLSGEHFLVKILIGLFCIIIVCGWVSIPSFMNLIIGKKLQRVVDKIIKEENKDTVLKDKDVSEMEKENHPEG